MPDVRIKIGGGASFHRHRAGPSACPERQGRDDAHRLNPRQGFSTLDRNNPGDPKLLIETSSLMTEFLREQNARVRVYLMATWSRADQTYRESGAWSGEPISAMARDVRAAYDTAAAAVGAEAVIPVGEAWNRAMQSGVADPNPYDGIEPEMLANAAFFAALSDLVATYGEDAVAKMTEGLSRRIHHGEFTLYRVTQ